MLQLWINLLLQSFKPRIMKKILLHSLLIISTTAFAQNDLVKNKAIQSADKIESKVIAWRRDFHEHPELGFELNQSCSLLNLFCHQ